MAWRGSSRMLAIGVVALLGIGGAVNFRSLREAAARKDSSNYTITYDHSPRGWVEVKEHPPQFMDVYRHPTSDVALRVSAAHMVSDEVPDDHVSRDELTNDFANRTRTQLGWHAAVLGTVECRGGSFRLIRRETVDRTVITAFAVRGNSTIVVSIAGYGDSRRHVDGHLKEFQAFLATCAIEPKRF